MLLPAPALPQGRRVRAHSFDDRLARFRPPEAISAAFGSSDEVCEVLKADRLSDVLGPGGFVRGRALCFQAGSGVAEAVEA